MKQLVKLAYEICAEAHAGQTDKVGMPYRLHPERVAARCATDAEVIVALLHDTIEDTDITAEYLLGRGFPQYIVDGVLSVTKREGESYDDFVARAKLNPIGRVVKIHDLEDNMDLSRLDVLTDDMVARYRKYLKAYHYLRSEDGGNVAASSTPSIKTKQQVWRERRADINRRLSSSAFYTGPSFNKERISIEMDDGTLIQEPNTIDSLLKFLREVGFDKAASLDVGFDQRGRRYPMVTREPVRADCYRGPVYGWYVLSKCPCTVTACNINRIADALDRCIICDVVPKG